MRERGHKSNDDGKRIKPGMNAPSMLVPGVGCSFEVCCTLLLLIMDDYSRDCSSCIKEYGIFAEMSENVLQFVAILQNKARGK